MPPRVGVSTFVVPIGQDIMLIVFVFFLVRIVSMENATSLVIYNGRYIRTMSAMGQVKELLDWAKKAKPVAKVGLALASTAVKVCAGLRIPTADFEATLGRKAGGALSDFVKEALDSGIEKMASVAGERLGGDNPAGKPRPRIQNVRAYCCVVALLPRCSGVFRCRRSSEYELFVGGRGKILSIVFSPQVLTMSLSRVENRHSDRCRVAFR